MGKLQVVQEIEKELIKQGIPDFRVGDTVCIHTKIHEGTKERIQMFQGTVIAKKGSGASETFSLHRVAYGVGMERLFLLHSPKIARIELVKEGKVRRAKLYNLRGKKGKAAKVKGRILSRTKKEKEKAEKATI